MSYQNPTSEINDVRKKVGGTSQANISDTEIDDELTIAKSMVAERTGISWTDTTFYYDTRIYLKKLIATASLMARFYDMTELRKQILKEIEDSYTALSAPGSGGVADTSTNFIVKAADYQTYPMNLNKKTYLGYKRTNPIW